MVGDILGPRNTKAKGEGGEEEGEGEYNTVPHYNNTHKHEKVEEKKEET